MLSLVIMSAAMVSTKATAMVMTDTTEAKVPAPDMGKVRTPRVVLDASSVVDKVIGGGRWRSVIGRSVIVIT